MTVSRKESHGLSQFVCWSTTEEYSVRNEHVVFTCLYGQLFCQVLKVLIQSVVCVALKIVVTLTAASL